jgi:hypothetical protein
MASNRRWRGPFRCCGSRHESAVVQLSLLGGIERMKYMFIRLGIPALCGLVAGLFYYPKALAASRAALESGDHAQITTSRILSICSEILLGGGLVLTLFCIIGYLLCQKMEKR